MRASDLKKIIDTINLDDDDVEIVIAMKHNNKPDVSIDNIIIYDCKIVIHPKFNLKLDE